jgi:hypothetical protein
MSETSTLDRGDLLSRSTERDTWLRRLLATEQEAFIRGVAAGRQMEADERDAAWNQIAAPIARGGPAFAELERRRWGPGGREHFGDPQPGDFPGGERAA